MNTAVVNARREFRRYIKGVNFMTPKPVSYGLVGDGSRWVYELSTGTGFDHEPIWGVSVLDKETGRIDTDLGMLCRSRAEADEHISRLQAAC